MYFLYATLLHNKTLLINLAITIGCLIIVLLIQYLVKKARKYSIQPIKNSLGDTDEEKKELPIVSLNEIKKFIATDLEHNALFYNEQYDYFSNYEDCPKKKFGACLLYDESAAPLGVIADFENVYFDYNHKHWLIQLQKGQYGLSCGSEIGIYQTSKEPMFINGYFHGSFYQSNSKEEELIISYTLLKKNDVFLTRKSNAWCVNSFRLGTFSEPADLVMHIRITFPTFGFCESFYHALIELGYAPETITIRQNTIYFVFDEPKYAQPLTKNILTTYIMQKNNYSFITAYDYLTQDYTDTLSKLSYLKVYFPEMYHELIKIGQPIEMYDDYAQIAPHLDSIETKDK